MSRIQFRGAERVIIRSISLASIVGHSAGSPGGWTSCSGSPPRPTRSNFAAPRNWGGPMSDLRGALARLLQEAAQQVEHGEHCHTRISDVRSGNGWKDWTRVCTCDYAQRVREKQAAVMGATFQALLEGLMPTMAREPAMRAALAAGQAQMERQ